MDAYAHRAAALRSIVETRLEPEAAAWLSDLVDEMKRPPDLTSLRVAFARCGRKLHSDPLGDPEALPPKAQRGLENESMQGWRPHWTLRDHARAILLLAALERTPDEDHVPLVEKLFRTGEIGEQESLLRVLPVVPDPERFVELAVEACRTNAETVFAAIACYNPFPAAHFPDLNFNQLVLKTIFIGLSTATIEGLPSRVTPELLRMLQDFAAERRAAGRPVPEDIDRIARMSS